MGAEWRPQTGRVQLKAVSMRYAKDLPLVLNQVTIDVHARSKVGVVGRTGAGKSSLVLAVFRMVQLEKGGCVLIDGQDLQHIPVRTLRASLGMIPQDPTIW